MEHSHGYVGRLYEGSEGLCETTRIKANKDPAPAYQSQRGATPKADRKAEPLEHPNHAKEPSKAQARPSQGQQKRRHGLKTAWDGQSVGSGD